MRDLGHPADEWGTVPDTVMGGPSAISPIRVEYDVDREVHATAGQEAGATCSAVITGPQKRGTGGTLISAWKECRGQGHPPIPFHQFGLSGSM
jgi:hypothetical protein